MTTTPVAPPITRTCKVGNHTRCLGTVHDPVKGLVPCECPTPDCGHGTDTVKARRGKQ